MAEVEAGVYIFQTCDGVRPATGLLLVTALL